MTSMESVGIRKNICQSCPSSNKSLRETTSVSTHPSFSRTPRKPQNDIQNQQAWLIGSNFIMYSTECKSSFQLQKQWKKINKFKVHLLYSSRLSKYITRTFSVDGVYLSKRLRCNLKFWRKLVSRP